MRFRYFYTDGRRRYLKGSSNRIIIDRLDIDSFGEVYAVSVDNDRSTPGIKFVSDTQTKEHYSWDQWLNTQMVKDFVNLETLRKLCEDL